MRGDSFSLTGVPRNATRDRIFRIQFSEKKQISCVIINTSLSGTGQTLWVGLNGDNCILPLSPGESFPIASREDGLLVGSVSMHWENETLARTGIVVMGLDVPNEKKM
jgi:hypothetical protein